MKVIEIAEAEAEAEDGNEDGMEVDKQKVMKSLTPNQRRLIAEDTLYTSTEAAPSFRPHPHYCDIMGLEGPYTDPKTMLRYHDKDVYEIVRGLVSLAKYAQRNSLNSKSKQNILARELCS